MGRTTTPAKRSKPRSSSISDQLQRAREALAALQEEAAETGTYSVEHCSRMSKYWGAQFLRADELLADAKDNADRAQALSLLSTASREAGEWEKRKAGAMASLKADLLAQVLERLEQQEALASELLEIEE